MTITVPTSTHSNRSGNDTRPTSEPPLLEMRRVSKHFAGIKALDDAQLTVEAGEVHAIMGENGAGKSTLIKILSGAYTADTGEVRIDGARVDISSPSSAMAFGIAVIYQELSLSPNLTVAENIYLGREIRRGLSIDHKAMQANCRDLLKNLGASFLPTTMVSNLSLAEQQLVEIARAVHTNVRILVMDEPTASLSSKESELLFDLIQRLRTQGLAIIYVSHRMAEISLLADRVTVLRDGRYIETVDRANLSQEHLVRIMVGRDLAGFYMKEPRTDALAGKDPFFEVSDIRDNQSVHGCSLSLRQGEILGIAGLVGSGRTEMARLIFGAETATGGKISLDGKPLRIASPRDAIDAGIVYLTEDRKGLGLFLDMSVHDNVNAMVMGMDAHSGGAINFNKSRSRARQAIDSLSIRVRNGETWVGSLSGGNQQKVLLSRLLQRKPRVILLDEPTRGVDIGAKSEIYRIMDELASEGMGIIFISSELPEIIGISDRVLVMREGIIAGELDPAAGTEITQEAIMLLATSEEQTHIGANA